MRPKVVVLKIRTTRWAKDVVRAFARRERITEEEAARCLLIKGFLVAGMVKL